jgi:hypothetical protein
MILMGGKLGADKKTSPKNTAKSSIPEVGRKVQFPSTPCDENLTLIRNK